MPAETPHQPVPAASPRQSATCRDNKATHQYLQPYRSSRGRSCLAAFLSAGASAALQSSLSISSRNIHDSEVIACGRSAKMARSRFGTEITHGRIGTGGITRSARCAAFWAICRPVQDGLTPRPLHENATSKPWPQLEHRARANPKQSNPQVRYRRNSSST